MQKGWGGDNEGVISIMPYYSLICYVFGIDGLNIHVLIKIFPCYDK